MSHHGEYKVPGGKLVKVDFDVAGGALTGVVVSGDFFLYPEEALEDLRAALEGLPVAQGEPEIAARVGQGIRPGAELLGTSPEAIAIAVRRALEAGPAA